MGENLPTWYGNTIDVDISDAFSIDGNDNTLVTKFLRGFTNELRRKYCCRINRDFIRTSILQIADISDFTHTAADS